MYVFTQTISMTNWLTNPQMLLTCNIGSEKWKKVTCNIGFSEWEGLRATPDYVQYRISEKVLRAILDYVHYLSVHLFIYYLFFIRTQFDPILSWSNEPDTARDILRLMLLRLRCRWKYVEVRGGTCLWKYAKNAAASENATARGCNRSWKYGRTI